MAYLVTGFVLCAIFMVASIASAWTLNPEQYFDIWLICGSLGESAQNCHSNAIEVGITTLLGIAIWVPIIWKLTPRSRPLDRRWVPEERALDVLVVLASIAASGYILSSLLKPIAIDRVADITEKSNWVSLCNLAWPLVLQFCITVTTFRARVVCYALLGVLTSLSPFRGMIIAVVVFGIIAFGAIEVHRRWKSPSRAPRWILLLIASGLISLTLALGMVLLLQTKERESNLQSMDLATASLGERLRQRMTIPIYQAHLAEQLAIRGLPSVRDEFFRKVRLSDNPTLNEFLYGFIYESGTVGEATSLLYGEAAANMVGKPIVWISLAPMLFVLIYRIGRRMGLECGVLTGVAAWRGFHGGVATVLPALIVQMLLLYVMARWLSKADNVERRQE